MEQPFPHVKKAVNDQGIVGVVPGLPFDASGFFLTDEQMTLIDSSLATAETTATALVTANDLLGTANALVSSTQTELATAQADLSTANTALATAQARVTELEALSGQSAKTGKGADSFEKAVDMKQFETSYDRMFAQGI